MEDNKKVLVIIPAYNEQDSIVSTVEKLNRDCPYVDYLVVNDCSKDDTLTILKNKSMNYVSLPVNLGIGGAVQSGYKYALKNDYDIAVQLDGDGQHDSAYLDKVIEPLLKDEADIAIGSRFIKREGFQSSGMRRAGIGILNFWIRLTTGFKVTDCTSGFRAVNKKGIELYAREYPVDYPEPEAIVYAVLKGLKIKEVPVVMKERTTGVSSIRPIHSIYYMVKVTLAILLCRFSNRRVR